MTQKSVSRKQRYNTLDFAEQNRVPTGMLPLQSLISLAGAYTAKMQLATPAQQMQKKAVLPHDMRMAALLSFIELQHRTGSAKPVQYLH